MLQLDSPLWQFAIQFYQKGKNAPNLLALQEREGLWINHWLATLWAAKAGCQLPSQPDALLLQWHEQVVLPVREMRQAMRASTLYASLLDMELEKERVELAHWFRLAQPQTKQQDDWFGQWRTSVESLWPQWRQWPEAQALSHEAKAQAAQG